MSETTPDAAESHAALRLRPEIVALPAYRQGKPAAADAFKLSSNENPFDPLPGVIEAVVAETQFNRYPDATALALRTELAARHGVTPDQVHIGSGSVALLAQLILATSAPGTEVVYSWRSFEAYPGLVTVSGAASVQVPNTPDHGHDLPAIAAAVGENTSLVIICSPNNPTGNVVGAEEFAAFMAAVPTDVIVVLDEAYAEFVHAGAAAAQTLAEPAVNGLPRGAAPLSERYPNLVILRTFSKAYGLAALRVGFAIGAEGILDAARSTAIPLSVTAQGSAAALASLAAEKHLLDRVAVIADRRDGIHDALTAQGWALPRSYANFLWLPLGAETAAAAETLSAAGLIVRAFPDGIRISVGEEEATPLLLAAAQTILDSLAPGHPARRER
ncbi:histidinol-phosphate transaminase [Microterricola viridarii]|uniref:histidinol-phosphate transaminase n=1 Tax=Microterricola viridarii TaxID=412690 RepID=UPI0009EA1AD6|nr:histidinol-phosphate transaminase [Microterricola viridarii]